VFRRVARKNHQRRDDTSGVGGLSWRRELHTLWAGLRFAGSSASCICPVCFRMRRGMTWSTLSAPGCPHNQHTFDAARTWALMRRQGLPFLPAAMACVVGHEA